MYTTLSLLVATCAAGFQCGGVQTCTSLSVSLLLHVLQGSSVVVYRHAQIRKFQVFACSEWPGGLFGSPTITGSRPGNRPR